MNIENVWKQNDGNDETLDKLLEQADFESLHSKLPLKKLKRSLLGGMVWAIIITAAYITILFFIHVWPVYVTLGILVLFNLWLMLESWKLYKQTPSSIIPTNSLKQELINNYNGFQKWWSLQLKVSLVVYPIATAGGFILGGMLGSGKTPDAFLYNARMLGFLGVTILVFMPLSYYANKWMFSHSYGKHLMKLKLLIEELSENREVY